MNVQLSQDSLLRRLFLPHLIVLVVCLKINWQWMCGFISGPSALSIDLVSVQRPGLNASIHCLDDYSSIICGELTGVSPAGLNFLSAILSHLDFVWVLWSACSFRQESLGFWQVLYEFAGHCWRWCHPDNAWPDPWLSAQIFFILMWYMAPLMVHMLNHILE